MSPLNLMASYSLFIVHTHYIINTHDYKINLRVMAAEVVSSYHKHANNNFCNYITTKTPICFVYYEGTNKEQAAATVVNKCCKLVYHKSYVAASIKQGLFL